MTSIQRTHRDLFFSLLAQGLPAVIALVCIPILLKHYGIERFGLLTFFWVLLNWISFLDLGISRTLTKTLAEDKTILSIEAKKILKASALVIFIMSGIGVCILIFLQQWILNNYLTISPEILSESKNSLYAIAACFPALLFFSFCKSAIEGKRHFKEANKMQFVVGISNYAAPLLAILFTNRLDAALCLFSITRWLLLFWSISKIRKIFSLEWLWEKLISSDYFQLFRSGIWFALLTIINPLLIYLDRFLVSNYIPMSELAYYTTPFEIVTRFWLIPTAITRILFPIFSAERGAINTKTIQAFRNGLLWIGGITIPTGLILSFWSRSFFEIWLNKHFSENSGLILPILIFGVIINCLNWIPFTFIQTSKHIRWTVYIPLAELILFLILFFPLVSSYGSLGAAIAWSLRLVFDALIWFGICGFLYLQQKNSKDND